MVLAVVLLAGLIPWLVYVRALKSYLRFVILILTPIALALVVVWGGIVQAPPGEPLGSSPKDGMLYAATIILRLGILSGLIQALFSGLKGASLLSGLKAWGVSGDLLVIILGTFVMLPEGRLRAEQVLTSRLARGLVKKRGFVGNVKQLPHVLRPMLGWTLRAAIERAELWQHRDLLRRITNHEVDSERPKWIIREIEHEQLPSSPMSNPRPFRVGSVSELVKALQPRQITALVGENFSGRTDALRSLVGLLHTPAVTNLHSTGAYVGSETHSAMSGLAQTSSEELQLHLEPGAGEQSLAALSELFGMAKLAERNPTTLSGGEQVSLALTCALVGNPAALAIDCAFEQLDYRLRSKFLSWLASNSSVVPTTVIADNRFEEYSAVEQEALSATALIESTISEPTVVATRYPAITGGSLRYQFTSRPFSLGLQGLGFHYVKGVPILDDISATFSPGDLYVIEGRNGSGKSTLAKLLSGILRQSRGSMLMEHAEYTPWVSPGRLVAYHFQNPDVQLFSTSVLEEIKSGAKAHGLHGDSLERQSTELLEAFGLTNVVDRHPLDLPFVVRKRVAIAATLAAGCPWIILDEPTLGQDHKSCQGLIEILDNLREVGAGIIVISHSTAFKKQLKNSITLVVKCGALMKMGRADE
jgi:energy-coupling factor transport system ATP-binding protein